MNTARSMSVLMLALPLLGCPELGTQERTIVAEIPAMPSFTTHVKPILDRTCNECHSVPPQQLAPPTIRLDTCEDVGGVLGAKNQSLRIKFRLIDKVPSPMPPSDYAAQPTDDDVEIVRRWVDQGANCDGGVVNVNPNNGGGDMGMVPGMDMNMVGMDMNALADSGADMPDLPPPPPTWAEVTALVNDRNCALCHGAGRGNLMFPMDATPAELQTAVDGVTAMNGDMNPFVTPNDPMASELWLRITGTSGAIMPQGEMVVDQELADAVQSWILDGAPYN